MGKKIEFLKNIPQPDQRTNEWYVFRHNLLTASSIWKCLHSEASRNQLIYEKCQTLNVSKFRSSNIETPFHWGQKYEPLSVMWYELKYSTVVEDFGCIQHQKYKFIGASPDGINTLDHHRCMVVCWKSRTFSIERSTEFRKRSIGYKCNCNGNCELNEWIS